MQTRVYKIFASNSADVNAAAFVTFQQSGLITAILGNLAQTGAIADDEEVIAELSFASAAQTETNDTVGCIAQMCSSLALTTSGGCQKAVNLAMAGIAIPVVSGDRLFTNVNQTGTLVWRLWWFVYLAV